MELFFFARAILLMWPHLSEVRILNDIHNKCFCLISELLKELDEAYEKHCHEEDPIQQGRLLHCIQRALIRSQELGDEKIQLASQMVEMVENRSRQVDGLAELLETQHEPQESMTAITISSVIPSKRREEEKRKEESLGSIERISGAIKRSKRQKNSNIDTQDNISTVHHDEGTVSIVREKRNKPQRKRRGLKPKLTESLHLQIYLLIRMSLLTACVCRCHLGRWLVW